MRRYCLVIAHLLVTSLQCAIPDGDRFYHSTFIRSVGNDEGENLRFCVTIKIKHFTYILIKAVHFQEKLSFEILHEV